MSRFDPGEPQTLADLAASFDRQRQAGEEFFSALPAIEFFAAPPGKWSPAQNLKHLATSNSQVALGLLLPGAILRLLFGKHLGPSRSYLAIRSAYDSVLAGGAQAGGKYVPPAKPRPLDPEPVQQKILKCWTDSLKKLCQRSTAWSEAAADGYQLPHPLIGKLTLREMLFFTAYHNSHHLNILANRLDARPV